LGKRELLTVAFFCSSDGVCETGIELISYQLGQGNYFKTLVVCFCGLGDYACLDCYHYLELE